MTAHAPSLPMLSVVVPTRNRYVTLEVLTDQLMAWERRDFELVIEDNSDDPAGFAAVLARHARDTRLRYRHSGATRSAIENCDAAAANARGTVAVFIGDDDTITRHCVDVAAWMARDVVDVVLCDTGSYVWPDMEHAVTINRAYNGRLIAFSTDPTLIAVDPHAELAALARSGAQTMRHIPRFYQSLVRRAVLDELRSRLGTCFPGPVPDMANAVAMTPLVRRVYATTLPVIVSGQSRASMSGRNSIRAHQGTIAAEPSLPPGAASRWDPRIPKYWSAPTIWAEAALKAAEASGQTGFDRHFGFAKVYAACLSYTRRAYHPLVYDAIFRRGRAQGVVLLAVIGAEMTRIATLRARHLLRKIIKGVPGTEHDTIAGAAAHIERSFDADALVERMLAQAPQVTR